MPSLKRLNLSADANLGTLMQVREIYGRGNTFRWTQFWYDQLLLDNVVDVKLGRMGVGEDFMSFSCYFQNLSFCGSLPGNIVSTWYNWPVSQWAARLKINVTPEWYAQIGAYQINSAYIQTSDVFKLNNPSGTIGALIPVVQAGAHSSQHIEQPNGPLMRWCLTRRD